MKISNLRLVAVIVVSILIENAAVLHADTLFVSNYGNSTVSKISSSGEVTHHANIDQKPFGIAFRPNGDLLVASSQFTNKINRISSGGIAGFYYNLPRGFDATIIAFDPRGRLFTASQGGYGVQFFLGLAPQSYAPAFTSPFGMAFDRAGNLFVSDQSRNDIQMISPNRSVVPFASNVSFAYGLAFDADGNLYASASSQVLKFNPQGERSIFATGFSTAAGLAFDSAGDLYVADWNGTVKRVTPDGVVHPFASGLSQPLYIAIQPDFSAPTLSITAPGVVSLKGGLNLYYIVSYSDDLNTWTPLSTNQIVASSTVQIIDPQTDLTQSRFYKARLVQ